MSAWSVQYWCDVKGKSTVESWLDNLSKEELKSVAKEIKLLECCGHNLRLPHSRALQNGLFELRERTYGYRIYYTFLSCRKIVLLHAGRKSRQTKDIATARKRLVSLNHI